MKNKTTIGVVVVSIVLLLTSLFTYNTVSAFTPDITGSASCPDGDSWVATVTVSTNYGALNDYGTMDYSFEGTTYSVVLNGTNTSVGPHSVLVPKSQDSITLTAFNVKYNGGTMGDSSPAATNKTVTVTRPSGCLEVVEETTTTTVGGEVTTTTVQDEATTTTLQDEVTTTTVEGEVTTTTIEEGVTTTTVVNDVTTTTTTTDGGTTTTTTTTTSGSTIPEVTSAPTTEPETSTGGPTTTLQLIPPARSNDINISQKVVCLDVNTWKHYLSIDVVPYNQTTVEYEAYYNVKGGPNSFGNYNYNDYFLESVGNTVYVIDAPIPNSVLQSTITLDRFAFIDADFGKEMVNLDQSVFSADKPANCDQNVTTTTQPNNNLPNAGASSILRFLIFAIVAIAIGTFLIRLARRQ